MAEPYRKRGRRLARVLAKCMAATVVSVCSDCVARRIYLSRTASYITGPKAASHL